VGVEQIAGTLKERGDRPLCILDIAVPRDVDPAVASLSNVFLYDLDDLRTVAASNIERRRDEMPAVEEVIVPEVEKYWEWLAGLAAVPVLRTFRTEMDRLREAELAETMRKLEHLSSRDREAIEHFSRALMNKFLHEPSVRLRAAAANGRGLGVVDALRYLFDLRVADAASADGTPDAPAAEER
jgi:glutamyl-tRNA reductase